MKIHCSITDEEYDKIQPYIECQQFSNPIQDEFVFYYPTERFLIMLALFNITYYKE
jgi:hypothetical protein